MKKTPLDPAFSLMIGRPDAIEAFLDEVEELDALPAERYRVRYYDAKMSRKGQGVQVRTFTDAGAAAEFASRNRLYSKPCKVDDLWSLNACSKK